MNGSSPEVVNNFIIGGLFGIMSYYDSNPEIINNTIVECETGVEMRAFFDMAVSEPRIINNIIAGCGTALSSLNGAVPSEVGNNLLWDNDVDYSEVARSASDMFTDPRFSNPGEGDYHIASDSPCIDAGTDVPGVPTTDAEGDPRPLDGNGDGAAVVDIGADESQGDGVVPDEGPDEVEPGEEDPVGEDGDPPELDGGTPDDPDFDGGGSRGRGCACSTASSPSEGGAHLFLVACITLALLGRAFHSSKI